MDNWREIALEMSFGCSKKNHLHCECFLLFLVIWLVAGEKSTGYWSATRSWLDGTVFNTSVNLKEVDWVGSTSSRLTEAVMARFWKEFELTWYQRRYFLSQIDIWEASSDWSWKTTWDMVFYYLYWPFISNHLFKRNHANTQYANSAST